MTGFRCASLLMSIVPNVSDRTVTATCQKALTSAVVPMHGSSVLERANVPQVEAADPRGGHVSARPIAARSTASANLDRPLAHKVRHVIASCRISIASRRFYCSR